MGPRTLCNACGLVFAKLVRAAFSLPSPLHTLVPGILTLPTLEQVRKRAKEASREKEKEKEKEKHSSEHGLQGQTGRGKKISKKRIKGGVID